MDRELTREERMKLREQRRQRRRKRLDQVLSARAMVLIIFIYLLIALLLLVMPRPKKSQIEKRDLAKFPRFSVSRWFSGEFTHDLTTWYDDTVPGRDRLKNANNSLKKYAGINTSDSVEIVGNVAKVEEEKAGKDEKDEDDDAAAGEPKDYAKDDAEGAFNNGFLIIQQNGHCRGLPLFAGGEGGEFTEFLNELQSKTGENVHIYAMPIPLASAYYLPKNFSDYSKDQRAMFEGIFEKMDKDITPIRLIDVLGKHEDEDIFLRTDHHWSDLGAFYASRALAKAADLPYIKLKEYHKIERPGYVGSMYGYTQSAKLKDDPEVFPIYIPGTSYVTAYHDPDYTFSYQKDLFTQTDTANSYLAFHAGDALIVHTVTGMDNGRKLLILKDSYGNPLSGMLTGTFEEIFSVDLRYCNVNLLDFIEKQEITDVVIAMDIDTVASPTADLHGLLTQNAGSAIPDDEPDMEVPSGPGSPYYEDAGKGEDPLLLQ